MAVFERIVPPISVEASADLSANQFHFVDVNTSGQLALAGAGGNAIGVLLDKPDAVGVAGEVQVLGEAKVVAGTGGLTAGDLVMSDANGEAVTATATNRALGRAMETVAATEIGRILLFSGVGHTE